jgi:hypothetical protein
MFPTSGGQYYWVAVLAPRRYRRYLSYITGKLYPSHLLSLTYSTIGWLCAITWQTSLAGCAYIAGTLVQGLIIQNLGTAYNFQRWHGSLLTLVFILLAIVFNTFLARKLPLLEVLFVIFHILGVVIFIPVWVFSPRRDVQGGSPLIEFYNAGGWVSNGLATMVGTIAPVAGLIGLDCSVHMGMLSLEFHLLSLTSPYS